MARPVVITSSEAKRMGGRLVEASLWEASRRKKEMNLDLMSASWLQGSRGNRGRLHGRTTAVDAGLRKEAEKHPVSPGIRRARPPQTRRASSFGELSLVRDRQKNWSLKVKGLNRKADGRTRKGVAGSSRGARNIIRLDSWRGEGFQVQPTRTSA